MAPSSSPTLGELVVPKNIPPLLSFLLRTLRLHFHVGVKTGPNLSLSIQGSSSELTDYYTVLATLQKMFVSTVAVASQAVQGVEGGLVKEKGLGKKELAALISRCGENQSFINGTPCISLGDLYVYFSLKGDEKFEGDWFSRWHSCVASFVAESVNDPVGFSDAGLIGKVETQSLNGAKTADPVFVELASANVVVGSGGDSQGKEGGDKKAGGKAVVGAGGGMSEEEKKAAREKREAAKAAKAAKKPPKEKAAAAAAPTADGPTVGALEIRVGKLVKVWPHETADKLFCEDIDLGPELGIRQIASGLRPFYKQEDMEGKLVMVLCNLKKRNLVGFPSHGMVMCASNDDHTDVELVIPPEGVPLGERIICAGFDTPPEPENKVAKKKIFEKIAPELVTDNNGVPTYKGVQFMTTKGPCVAEKKMKGGHVA